MSAAESLLLPIPRLPVTPDTAWTVEAIAARRATRDGLVTRGGWSVSFDTSPETGKVARLSCFRWMPGTPFEASERDVMDGQTFATTADAECYALNAGRLQWYGDWKRAREGK